MRSTFSGLEIGKMGLFASQRALDLTGHNISNSETEGYTRQRLYNAAIAPASMNSLIMEDKRSITGRGVETLFIEQVRNPFLDRQYREENTKAMEYSKKEQYYSYVETMFNEELEEVDKSTGMHVMFADFYKAMNEFAKSTADVELRSNVQKTIDILTTTMNNFYGALQEQQTTVDDCVMVSTIEINGYARDIAMLNEQIFGFELGGARANDLRDQRNLLLDELSGIIPITYKEDDKGYMKVLLDNSVLVNHSESNQLVVARTKYNNMNEDNYKYANEFPPVEGNDRLYEIYWADNKTGEPIMTRKVEVTGGAIRGYMDVRDGQYNDVTKGDIKYIDNKTAGIPAAIQELNALCRRIAKDMNEVHKKGWTLPIYEDTPSGGVWHESRTGVNMFHVEKDEDGYEDYSTVTALNFRLSDDLLDNVRNFAGSDVQISINNGNPENGNNNIANKLIKLLYDKDAANNPDNFNADLYNIITNVATEMQGVRASNKAHEIMKKQIYQQRVSVSGVSRDEEMTLMVQFSHSYKACSRVITAMDEALDKLINGTGMVGR